MKLLTRGWAFLAALLVGGMLVAAPAPARAECSGAARSDGRSRRCRRFLERCQEPGRKEVVEREV